MENYIPSLGGNPSPKDYRDIPLGQVVPQLVSYPDKYLVDISLLPVWYQRKIGACVGHACGKYKQSLDIPVTTPNILPLSARFLYAYAKALDGYEGEGTYPRLVMKILKDVGCSTERTLPNDTTLDHEAYVFYRDINKIPKVAIEEASLNKIKSYASVSMTKLGIQQACFSARGLSLLVKLDESWWSDKNGVTWDKDRILPLCPPRNSVGGHQIYIYGYEVVGNDMKVFFLNSWSKDWADNGCGWFWLSEYQASLVEGWTAVNIPDYLLEEVKNLPPVFSHHFYRSINYGESNEEVKALQRALLIDGEFDYIVTGYYGTITSAAVKAFQRKYQVASLAEINGLNGRSAGPKTRKKLNELFDK
jgi:hypothetical protein